MPRHSRLRLVPLTALIACAMPCAGASAAPLPANDPPLPRDEAIAVQAAKLTTVRALVERKEDRRARAVDRDDIRPGDLVFFSTAGPGASHVGIATGKTTVVSATSSGGVMEHSSTDAYWGGHYVGARRIG